jgi:four helix bundle protein
MSGRSFRDLDVYQTVYQSCIVVMRELLPYLPPQEKFDLRDQLSRACKAVPRLLAEGYAKKHQRQGFQKYIDDAMGECNECIVCIEQIKDIYMANSKLCDELITAYDRSARQLFCLAEAWDSFKLRSRTTPTDNNTRRPNQTHI